jgi:hypothetical protein
MASPTELMNVSGACHCGEISFEALVNPRHVAVCHCTDCQIMSGAPFRAVAPVRADRFTLLTGTPAEYVKVADSGNRRSSAFCPTCGTQLWGTDEGPTPIAYGLRVGALAQREQLIPQAQIWCRSTLSWTKQIDAIKEWDTTPG